MNQPSLYTRANNIQRRDAKEITAEFADILRFNPNQSYFLLDVGCGSGDVLMDFIYPILPKKATKVIGVDISPVMLEYSKKTYANYDNVEFKELDIEAELPLEYHERFNHVTSFYCLNWIQNHRKSLENIYKSLSNPGHCLLVFLKSVDTFNIYKTLSTDPRWSEYMKDVDKFIPTFHKSSKVEVEYSNLLKEAGFVDVRVEIRDKMFVYKNTANFKENMKAINPFICRMPINLQEELITEICKLWNDLGLCERMTDTNDYKFNKPYALIVAYAKKLK